MDFCRQWKISRLDTFSLFPVRSSEAGPSALSLAVQRCSSCFAADCRRDEGLWQLVLSQQSSHRSARAYSRRSRQESRSVFYPGRGAGAG